MIANLLLEPAWQRLAVSFLHFLWQGAVILGLTVSAIYLFGLRRGQPRHVAYLVGFVALTLCPIITYLCLEPVGPGSGVVASGRSEVRADAVTSPDLTASYAVQGGLLVRRSSTIDSSVTAQSDGLIRNFAPTVITIWLIGVSMLSVRLMLGLIGIKKLKADCQPLPAEHEPLITRLTASLDMLGFTRITCSKLVEQPVALGYLKSTVILPFSALTHLPPEALRAMIAHELAHIRRLDLWVDLFQRIVETLLFFHPVVWWLSTKIREEREICCDDIAVAATGERLAYASMLERAFQLSGSIGRESMALGMADKTTLARVRRVLGMAPPNSASPVWMAGASTFLLCLGLVLAPEVKIAYAQETNEEITSDQLLGKWHLLREDATVEFLKGGAVEVHEEDEHTTGTYVINGDELTVELDGDDLEKARFRLDGDLLVVGEYSMIRDGSENLASRSTRENLIGKWYFSEEGATVEFTKDGKFRILQEGGSEEGTFEVHSGRLTIDLGGWLGSKDGRFYIGANMMIFSGEKLIRIDGKKTSPETVKAVLGIWSGEEGTVRFLPEGKLEVMSEETGFGVGTYMIEGDFLTIHLQEAGLEPITVPFHVTDDGEFIHYGDDTLMNKVATPVSSDALVGTWEGDVGKAMFSSEGKFVVHPRNEQKRSGSFKILGDRIILYVDGNNETKVANIKVAGDRLVFDREHTLKKVGDHAK